MYGKLALAAAAAFSATTAEALLLNGTGTTAGYINYTTVTGFFLQDVNTTNASTFDYTATNFGLINQTYPELAGLKANLTQWQQFEAVVDYMNAAAPLNTAYKLLWLGRHGDGIHNDAQNYYGTPAWNCYYAELNGNATATWFDAHLSALGVQQAQVAHDFWAYEIANQHIPYPQSYYTSPLTRCLQTANITFSGLDLPAYYPFVPTVRELFRESIDIHTCDRRSNRTYIHNLFPNYNIDPDLTEYDELWNGVTGETNEAQDARSLRVLDSVFNTDDHTWISITSHSGEISSLLRVLGHQVFSLATGAVIPVLVKAEFLPTGPAPTVPPYTTSTHCDVPPITSIATLSQGCVCANNQNITSVITQESALPTTATSL